MSNTLAYAAVTTALQSVILRSVTSGLPADVIAEMNLGNTRVTTTSLDRLRNQQQAGSQINLCVYRVTPNAALRNLPAPRDHVGPLAVDLHYLISVHCPSDDDRPAQVLLAQTQQILHDRAVLHPAELRAVLPGNDVAEQIESVRLHPENLTIEELSRLWSMYQAQARLAVSYVASVVVLDSATTPRAPLPVLRPALTVRVDTRSTLPTLLTVRPPAGRDAAVLGDTLTLTGQGIGSGTPRVALAHARWSQPILLAPLPGFGANDLQITLPIDPANWPAGPYTATVRLVDGDRERTTEPVPFALAPTITSPLPLIANRTGRDANLSLTCAPAVLPTQRVALLVGEVEAPAARRDAPTQTLDFTLVDAPVGTFFVRLRVDGVESDLIDHTADTPTFDLKRQLTIT